jgi:putative ABC transport system ATP-binding protein
MTLVKLNDVYKIYQMGEVQVPALRGISLEIKNREFVAIVGQSGSGKSTMMNMVGCLDRPTKGTVMLKGQDISRLTDSNLAVLRGRTIGFIFQQYNLIPSMTAFDNVMLPLELQEINSAQAKRQVHKVLEMVDLGDKTHHLPSQLSGGQQQRVSIARALAPDPEIILADEPTGALDSKTGKDVLNTLQELWKKGKTIIMVTHDLHLAKYAQRQIELKDGRIVKGG